MILKQDKELNITLSILVKPRNPSTPRSRFAKRLTAAMRERHMTPPTLGQKVGAHSTTVFHWMSGRRLPQPQYYKGLCTALHKRHADLILDQP